MENNNFYPIKSFLAIKKVFGKYIAAQIICLTNPSFYLKKTTEAGNLPLVKFIIENNQLLECIWTAYILAKNNNNCEIRDFLEVFIIRPQKNDTAILWATQNINYTGFVMAANQYDDGSAYAVESAIWRN